MRAACRALALCRKVQGLGPPKQEAYIIAILLCAVTARLSQYLQCAHSDDHLRPQSWHNDIVTMSLPRLWLCTLATTS